MAIGDLLYKFRADARPLEQGAQRAERALRDVGDAGDEAGGKTVESTKLATKQMEKLGKEADDTSGRMGGIAAGVKGATNSVVSFAGSARGALQGVSAAVEFLSRALERLDTVAEKARETLFETEQLAFRTGLTESQQEVLNQLAIDAGAEPEQLAEGLLALREKIQLGSIPEEDLAALGLTVEGLTKRYERGEFTNAVQLLNFISGPTSDLIERRGEYEAASALETLAGGDSQALLRVIQRGVTYEEQVAHQLAAGTLLAPEEFDLLAQQRAEEGAINRQVEAQLRAENRATLASRQAIRSSDSLGDVLGDPQALLGLFAYVSEFATAAIQYPTNPTALLEKQAEILQPVTINVEGSVTSQEDIADAVLRALDAGPTPLTRQSAARTGLP